MGDTQIFLMGLGDLGGHVLEFLARVPGIHRLAAADINEDWGQRKTNVAILGASHMGFYPRIEFYKADVSRPEAIAELLRQVRPRVIFNGTSLQSWWVVEELPEELSGRLMGAGVGPWLPMHLTLTHKLMTAIRLSGLDGVQVVNGSFPDAVNPVLAKLGLAPTVGMGNFDLLVSRLRLATSQLLQVPMRNVQVYMVGHHCHPVRLRKYGKMDAPYYLKILVGDQEITPRLSYEEVFRAVHERLPTPGGRQAHPHVAGSAIKNLLALLHETGEITHAPGPCGLPGGYPVRLGGTGAEVVVPGGLTLQGMVQINEAAQRFDGIDGILDDGTVVFTDEAAEIMRTELGYDCKQLRVVDSEARAQELGHRFREFLQRHGYRS